MTPELVAAACAGEAGALERLLEAARPRLRRFAETVCAGPEDAEDAVQEALWALSRRLATFKGLSAFGTWAFAIVKYECLRLVRLGRRLVQGPRPERAPEQVDDPWAALDLHRSLHQALAELDPPHREVLILRDLEGRTAPEVAERLGLSVAAVKSRLHRARAAVRERLQSGSGDRRASAFIPSR